jgi:hypothetical protein
VRQADNNERNEIMKTVAYTGRFYTTPDRGRPPGAEIEQENLPPNFSSVADFDSIDFSLDPQTAARKPVLARRVGINGNEIDPQTLSTTPWPIGITPSTGGLTSAGSMLPHQRKAAHSVGRPGI